MKSKKILQILEEGWMDVEMIFHKADWHSSVPSNPGWYFIETDTPPEVFKGVRTPPPDHRHYNIPEKVKTSLSLDDFGACIEPTDNLFYVVYSGEAKNLKARAREHMSGHPKTG